MRKVVRSLWCKQCVVFLAIGVSGCVFGKRSEIKQPVDLLHGETYQNKERMIKYPAPFVFNSDYERRTILRGEVRVGKGIEQIPGKFAVIEILSDGKKVVEFTADSGGLFNIEAVLKNGHYVLRGVFNDREGKLPIAVSSYETKGLILEIP